MASHLDELFHEAFATRVSHSISAGGYVHLCRTHFPAHPSLPQHEPSCASFLPQAAHRRPGPVSSLGINERGARPRRKSRQKHKVAVEQEKANGHLGGHLSALVAYEMTGNKFEYVGKVRQCVVFVLPVESALKGVKREGPGGPIR